MKTSYKFLSALSLLALLSMLIITPARAFDGRAGENIVIEAGEVIEDDVYVTANDFVLDGTIKGDLIVFGTTITINGTVEGDLIAAGQSIVINGTVTDDARIAGAVLQISKTASVGGDVIAAGASLETKSDSVIKGELVVGAGQALLNGNVNGDVLAGVGSMELNGEFGGDVNAQVGDPDQGGPPPSMYAPNSNISFPNVTPGFTISKDAKIKGNLEYTQSKDIKIPDNVVDGKITRKEPVVDPKTMIAPPTAAELATIWTFNLFRTIVTLIVFGLLLGWLAPLFTKSLIEKVQNEPAASFGWGIIAYAAFFFSILVIIVIMITGGILFGALTLTGVSVTIISVGLLAISALILSFILTTVFLAKIIVAWLSGKLILARINPTLAEHKVWPLVIGVSIIALLTALPAVGWILGLLVMFIGLGALWLWGREKMQLAKSA